MKLQPPPPLWYNYHDWGGGGLAIGYLATKIGGGGLMGKTPNVYSELFIVFISLRMEGAGGGKLIIDGGGGIGIMQAFYPRYQPCAACNSKQPPPPPPPFARSCRTSHRNAKLSHPNYNLRRYVDKGFAKSSGDRGKDGGGGSKRKRSVLLYSTSLSKKS